MNTETKIIIGGALLTILLIVGAVFLLSREEQVNVSQDRIISKTGIHWHPNLTILIKEEKQEILANIGIGAVHQPIHTHDSSGTLHLEVSGLVTKDETTLGRFFRIWGKEFNSNCIFGKCNDDDGKVRMLVNGKENTDFENYLMKDKDSIEIRYE